VYQLWSKKVIPVSSDEDTRQEFYKVWLNRMWRSRSYNFWSNDWNTNVE